MRSPVLLLSAATGCATASGGTPPMYAELGAVERAVPARFDVAPERFDPDADYAERRAPVASETARAVAFTGAIKVVLARHVIAGWELEAGQVSSSSNAFDTTQSAFYGGAVAVVGATDRLGPLGLALEVAAGARNVERHTDDGQWFFAEVSGRLESRLHASLWLCPWLTLDTAVAADRAGLVGATLAIGIHFLAYDRR